MGGTFMSLPADYRDFFVRNLHDALSGHTSSSVAEAVRACQGIVKCLKLPSNFNHVVVASSSRQCTLGGRVHCSEEDVVQCGRCLAAPLLQWHRVSILQGMCFHHLVGLQVTYSEHSRSKCIGLTIETRPDFCHPPHLKQMLAYGCTRIEMGVQSVYEDVARDTNRGHTVGAVKACFRQSKEAGFKVVAHLMPDLPNVGWERDVESFREFFENPAFRCALLSQDTCAALWSFQVAITVGYRITIVAGMRNATKQPNLFMGIHVPTHNSCSAGRMA